MLCCLLHFIVTITDTNLLGPLGFYHIVFEHVDKFGKI